jgi:hypothetical protein
MTQKLASKGICKGHRMREVNRCTFFEWVLIKFGLYERFVIWREGNENS